MHSNSDTRVSRLAIVRRIDLDFSWPGLAKGRSRAGHACRERQAAVGGRGRSGVGGAMKWGRIKGPDKGVIHHFAKKMNDPFTVDSPFADLTPGFVAATQV